MKLEKLTKTIPEFPHILPSLSRSPLPYQQPPHNYVAGRGSLTILRGVEEVLFRTGGYILQLKPNESCCFLLADFARHSTVLSFFLVPKSQGKLEENGDRLDPKPSTLRHAGTLTLPSSHRKCHKLRTPSGHAGK